MFTPPFGIFFSEMTILKAGFFGPHLAVTSVFLSSLVVLFCGFFYQVGRLVLGRPEAPAGAPPDPEVLDLGMAATLLAALCAVGSAFWLPDPLLRLIHAATAVVWGNV